MVTVPLAGFTVVVTPPAVTDPVPVVVVPFESVSRTDPVAALTVDVVPLTASVCTTVAVVGLTVAVCVVAAAAAAALRAASNL